MRKGQRIVSAVLFVIYLVALVYLLFFSENYGRTDGYTTYQYNLVPFREIRRYLLYVTAPRLRLINIGGNILAFVPFGFFVPALFPGLRKWWLTTLVTALFSFAVEVIQLFARIGICDVDDVILNTAGGFLGFLLFALISRINKRYAKKQKV